MPTPQRSCAPDISPTPDENNPDTLAVNLSSDRVRVALTLIEGIRNGQSLGALLGYRFERGLHDDFQLAEVDKFIYPLRKAFPLVADAMSSTKTDPNIPIEAIEARNVLDGKKLVDRIQATTNVSDKVYPFGLPGMPGADPDQQQALNDVTSALLDTYDALADLALAEGVHQAVQGNYDRVASTIDAYTTGNFPPEPQVVQTPPAGIGLTHRVGLQFKPGLAAPAGATPRAQAEPAIDDWLKTFSPALNKIACTVVWNDPINGTPQQNVVTLADLDLRPIDMLYLLKPENAQGMTELDDRIIRKTIAARNPRPDAVLQIQYLTAGPNQFSMFEAGALLRELRTMLTQSRPLRASDVRRVNDASQKDDSQVFADAARIATPLADLKTLANDINAFLATLSPLLSDTTANRAAIFAAVDNTLAQAIGLLERASRFAMPSSGWGFAYDWLRTSFTDLLNQVSVLVKRWDQKLIDFSNALTAYDALPAGTSDADRYSALQQAELLVSSALEPLPATPAQLRLDLNGKGTAFQNRRNQFANVLGSARNFVHGIVQHSVRVIDRGIRFPALRHFPVRRSRHHRQRRRRPYLDRAIYCDHPTHRQSRQATNRCLHRSVSIRSGAGNPTRCQGSSRRRLPDHSRVHLVLRAGLLSGPMHSAPSTAASSSTT